MPLLSRMYAVTAARLYVGGSHALSLLLLCANAVRQQLSTAAGADAPDDCKLTSA